MSVETTGGAHSLRCIACGYDLHGVASDGVCPECGYSCALSIEAAQGVGDDKTRDLLLTGLAAIVTAAIAWYAVMGALLMSVLWVDPAFLIPLGMCLAFPAVVVHVIGTALALLNLASLPSDAERRERSASASLARLVGRLHAIVYPLVLVIGAGSTIGLRLFDPVSLVMIAIVLRAATSPILAVRERAITSWLFGRVGWTTVLACTPGALLGVVALVPLLAGSWLGGPPAIATLAFACAVAAVGFETLAQTILLIGAVRLARAIESRAGDSAAPTAL